jgi:hypothetical protein
MGAESSNGKLVLKVEAAVLSVAFVPM